MTRTERRKHLWKLAISILKENGINPIDEKMVLSDGGFFVVIRSKDLVRPLRFGPNMTDKSVTKYVKEEIEISKNYQKHLS